MSTTEGELYFAVLKGGYQVHRKVLGEPNALCGAHPNTVVRGARAMRIRAGWRIYSKEPTWGAGFNMNCKKCAALLEKQP